MLKDLWSQLRERTSTQPIDQTARSILMWTVFLVLILVVYLNLIYYLKQEIETQSATETVKQYAMRDLPHPGLPNNPAIVNTSLSDPSPTDVITVTIS